MNLLNKGYYWIKKTQVCARWRKIRMCLSRMVPLTSCLPLPWRPKANSNTCLATGGELVSNKTAPWAATNTKSTYKILRKKKAHKFFLHMFIPRNILHEQKNSYIHSKKYFIWTEKCQLEDCENQFFFYLDKFPITRKSNLESKTKYCN